MPRTSILVRESKIETHPMNMLMRPVVYLIAFSCLRNVANSEDLIAAFPSQFEGFVSRYCSDCHSGSSASSGLDFGTLSRESSQPDDLRRWIKVHDRLAAGEMPPHDAEQPTVEERKQLLNAFSDYLTKAETVVSARSPQLRRLTRREYENTIRDLFDMPGIALVDNLPADGESHGFDKVPEALDISHVNMAKYLESADHILDYAIATRPQPPTITNRRISLVNRGGFVAHIVMNGDGVLLKEGQPDPEFPPAGEQNHLDQGAHERWGSFDDGASVGLFRHEDESVSPYFIEHVTIYPARYRVRTSLWSFQWDKGKVLPGRGTEAARLSIVQLTGDGRGGQHPSTVLGYFNAPVADPLEHEITVWLNHNELIGFNTASLAPAANYYKPKRAMEFTGPGIVVDWLDIEGPLYESWPPRSHQELFGDLPIVEFQQAEHPDKRPPIRNRPRQLGAGMNRPDPEPGIWTVHSDTPMQDADRLLGQFLPKLFRRPVSKEVRDDYLTIVRERITAGDSFEVAMRAAYRNALVSPDFLFHIDSANTVEPQHKPSDLAPPLDNYGLACRLSYLLWNSSPDDELMALATSEELAQPNVLHRQVERLLKHPRSQRFVIDFLGQWLKLYDIAANDPDKKLYPEFSPYLQDAMVAETRAYFRELLDQDLDVSHLMQSDFVMINQKLANHYGIPNIIGTQIRRVPLPAECPRGGFLTQASLLKITANGTTTSPVPRGAFVMDRLLGEHPEPPPSNVAAIEPDVRGATTIREQLAKHRDNTVCASCHQRIDPPGFALEAFDVIGGFRTRYRSIGDGDPAERGAIDPFINISFRLGPPVDAAGTLTDGRAFDNVQEYLSLVTNDKDRLLRNLAAQFLTYGTGHSPGFRDRPILGDIIQRTRDNGGGIRTLLHEVIGSQLFTGFKNEVHYDLRQHQGTVVPGDASNANRFLMTATLPPVESPVIRNSEDALPQPTPTEFKFDDDHLVKVRVIGLFNPERTEAFRELMQRFPETEVISLSDDTAVATIRYAAESNLFRNANPEQVAQRLNDRVRQLSSGLFSLKLVGDVPSEAFERIDFSIVGLDCKACAFAVHDILVRQDGVVHAKASFRDGRATAWIAPNSVSREELESALKMARVTLRE